MVNDGELEEDEGLIFLFVAYPDIKKRGTEHLHRPETKYHITTTFGVFATA